MSTCTTVGKAIQVLLEDGFEPEGLTEEERSCIPRKATQVHHAAGEELSRTSARVRLVKRGTAIRATVGSRSTALFIRDGDSIDGVVDMQSIATANVREIMEYLEYLKCVDRG